MILVIIYILLNREIGITMIWWAHLQEESGVSCRNCWDNYCSGRPRYSLIIGKSNNQCTNEGGSVVARVREGLLSTRYSEEEQRWCIRLEKKKVLTLIITGTLSATLSWLRMKPYYIVAVLYCECKKHYDHSDSTLLHVNIYFET